MSELFQGGRNQGKGIGELLCVSIQDSVVDAGSKTAILLAYKEGLLFWHKQGVYPSFRHNGSRQLHSVVPRLVWEKLVALLREDV